MLRSEIGVVLALALAATSCGKMRVFSADGIAIGHKHPLLEKRAPVASAPAIRGGAPPPFDGKVTIVHFWASWSDDARATLPKMQALHAKYKDRGVQVVALALDDERAPIDDALDAMGASFPVGWDARKEVARAWLVRGVPTSFVVDRRGVVRAAFVRYDDGVDVEIETDVKILTADGTAVAVTR